MTDTRSAICLINWTLAAPTIDDGSYDGWVEGHRMFEDALELLPADILHVNTVPCHYDERLFAHAPLSSTQAIAALTGSGVGRVYVAGNYVERDVSLFARSLTRLGLPTTILFDVCGTADPMAKWQALADAVDNGVAVSTVQQTLRTLTAGVKDRALRGRLGLLLDAGLGEHALELSAA